MPPGCRAPGAALDQARRIKELEKTSQRLTGLGAFPRPDKSMPGGGEGKLLGARPRTPCGQFPPALVRVLQQYGLPPVQAFPDRAAISVKPAYGPAIVTRVRHSPGSECVASPVSRERHPSPRCSFPLSTLSRRLTVVPSRAAHAGTCSKDGGLVPSSAATCYRRQSHSAAVAGPGFCAARGISPAA